MGNDKRNSDVNDDIKCYIVRPEPKDGEKYYKNEDEWKKDYIEFLDLLNNGDETEILEHEGWVGEKKVGIGPYRDPDANCFEFYKDLATFLNEQEKQYIEPEESYQYEPCKKPFRIKVTNKKGELQFYLKSDQFGFSRPSTDHKHPYDIYLEKCKEEKIDKEDSEDSVNKVCKWMIESRTLGGSFLWPTDMMKGSYLSNYNTARGGSNPFENGKYKGGQYNNYPIEDRVDLTLLEIFLYYHKEEYPDKWNKTRLNKWFDLNEEANKEKAKQWFGHFGSFEKYVDFFCFNDFVHEVKNNNEKKYKPIDIVNSILVEEGDKLKGKETIREEKYFEKNRSDFSIYDKGHKDMETMFNNVNILITRRTKTMEKK